jgi:hypothetical protein
MFIFFTRAVYNWLSQLIGFSGKRKRIDKKACPCYIRTRKSQKQKRSHNLEKTLAGATYKLIGPLALRSFRLSLYSPKGF